MDDSSSPDHLGAFEARYLAFLETITHLRPSLHRYCSRMTGSVLDGEDVVQDALFQAYRKLDTFDDSLPLEPWLFRIAHNRCIDFLRRHEVRRKTEIEAATPDWVEPVEADGVSLGKAVEHVVMTLPPMERACVLLKDVFDYSLEEIAEMVGSTIGGIKAALHRGRVKLTALPELQTPPRRANAEKLRLLNLYVDRFNRRDWDGIRELIASDARIRVADRFSGPLSEAPYFRNYERLAHSWRMAVGEVDGEPAILKLDRDTSGWMPRSIVRLNITDDQIMRVVDYIHCPWVLPAASSVVVVSYS